jgi:hypothetical protein
LWDEYSGQQANATQMAQERLSRLPDTPNAAAVEQAPAQADGLFEMGFVGRPQINPVIQAAEEVTQREAQAQSAAPQRPARDWGAFQNVLNARQLERTTMKPLAENKYRTKETDAALRNATTEMARKYAASSKDLAGFGVLDIKTFDALADEPVEVRANAQKIVEDQMSRGEMPQWLSAIEQVKQSRESKGASGTGAQGAGSQAPDNTKLFEELELVEAKIGTNPKPDLMMRRDELTRQITQVEGPKQYQNQLGFLDRKQNELRDLMQTPETLIASGYTNPITGTPIQSIEEAQDAQNRLIARRQKTLVEMRNAGEEYWGGLPSPQTFQYESTIDDATRDLNRLGIKNVSPRQHLSSMRRKEWTDFTSNQGEGFVYVDVGPGGQKNLVQTTPVTPGPKKVKITEDNPFFTAAKAEGQSQAAMARGEKMKRLEGRRANLSEMDQEALRGSGNTGATWSTLAAGRMGSGAIPPVLSGESATAKAERYARLKQEVEDLERELSIVP